MISRVQSTEYCYYAASDRGLGARGQSHDLASPAKPQGLRDTNPSGPCHSTNRVAG